MDWDNAPGPLNAKLLEECSGDDGLAAGERVRVEQKATDERYDNNGEAAPEDL